MADLSSIVLITTLNINDLYVPNKRQGLTKMKKHDLALCYWIETHFRYNDRDRLKWKDWKKMYHIYINQKKFRSGYINISKIDIRNMKFWETESYIM